MAKPKKPRSFGRGFDLLLRHCEGWEDYFQERTRKPGRDMSFNIDLFDVADEADPAHREAFLAYHVDMAENAWRLRNAFKFKVDWQESMVGVGEDVAEGAMRTPMSIPFEQCAFLLENWVADADLLLLLDTRTADHIKETEEIAAGYDAVGIEHGDQFISAMPAMYKHGEYISFWPVELHYRMHGTMEENNIGLVATPTFARPTEHFSMSGNREDIHMGVTSSLYYVLWLLSRSETRKIPGLTPRNQRMGKPKGKRVFYEHHVVDVDPFAVKQVSGVPSGIKKGSPRFHAVRGFWRHYKQPIKSGPNKGKTRVWVNPQWRGNKDKGVVTKDYNIVRATDADSDPHG